MTRAAEVYTVVPVTTNETIVELLKRYVLQDAEQVVRIKNWPDGIALTTNLRHLVAGPEAADWSISAEAWVDDVVIAIRDDLLVEGQPERFGFLMLADGTHVYVNDPAAVAELGRRLVNGMDPVGYAQILVAFHPYSSAYRTVLAESDGLRRVLGQPELPDVEPIRLERTPDGLTLMFSSFARYVPPGGLALLDLFEWRVTVPAGKPAGWSSRATATGLPLDSRRDGVQSTG